MHRWLLMCVVTLLPAAAVAQPVPPDDQTAPGQEAPDDPAQPDAETQAEPAPVAAPTEPPPAADQPAPAVAEPVAAAGKEGGQASFTDIRLNLTLTNENVFADPGETIPSVPGWRFGVPNSLGTLFFDNYDTRFSGYETLSHAVLYKRYDIRNWEVEGALVIRINDLAEDNIDLSDAGSYIRVAHWFDPTRTKQNRVSLTAFPTSSDRFRLGYSYRLSWGGSDEYRRSREAVPGVKFQYDGERGYAFVGAKSAVVLDRSTAEEKAVLGVLVGAGYDVTPMLRVEGNAGCFDRGSNELQDVITEKVVLCGVSGQLAVHKDTPIGSSIDYALYRNDPENIQRAFKKVDYPGGLSWLVSVEGTVLGQTLKDPAVSGGTVRQYGYAGDINGRIKYNRTRFRADVQARDLAFILHSTPSLPTFSDFPEEYDRTLNYFAAIGADQNFPGTDLTLGAIVGVDMPATLTTPTGVIPGDTVMGAGTSTAVVRSQDDITILPPGEDALPQFALKLTSRLDFAEYFAWLVDAYYSYDPNQTRLSRDGPEDLLSREYGEFNQLGFNVTLQARF